MSNGDDGGNGDKTVRKSHIHRIYLDDDSTNDQWVDVERIDEIRYERRKTREEEKIERVAMLGQPRSGSYGYPYILTIWKFKWDNFDPDIGDGSVTKKKVFNPDDKGTYIEVPVRNGYEVEKGKEFQWKNIWYYFNNTKENNTRHGRVRKIIHYDVPAEALDGDGQPPRDPDDYLNCLRDSEEGNYLRVELIETFDSTEAKGVSEHTKRWYLDAKVDPLLKDPLKGGDVGTYQGADDQDGDGGIDPPWRLDPLQNIVNVNWGGIAVIFGPEADDAPDQKKKDPAL